MSKSSQKAEKASLNEEWYNLPKRMRSDPVRVAYTCQEEIREVDEKYREQIYDRAAVMYLLGIYLSSHSENWALLRNEPFFTELRQGKPKENDDRERIIYWVCRFMFGAIRTDGRPYNRAYKYARALQRYAREGTNWMDVPEKLMEDGGVEHAYDLAAEERQPEAANDDDDRQEDEEDDGESEEPKHKGGPGSNSRGEGKRPPVTKGTGSRKGDKVSDSDGDLQPPAPAPKRFDPKKHLAVEMELDALKSVLALEVGGSARITVEVDGQIGPWKRIVARKVEIDDSDL